MKKINSLLLILVFNNFLWSQETQAFSTTYLTKEPEFKISTNDSIPLEHFYLAGVINVGDTSTIHHFKCLFFRKVTGSPDVPIDSLEVIVRNISTSVYNPVATPNYFMESSKIYFAMHDLTMPVNGFVSVSAFNYSGALLRKETYSLDF